MVDGLIKRYNNQRIINETLKRFLNEDTPNTRKEHIKFFKDANLIYRKVYLILGSLIKPHISKIPSDLKTHLGTPSFYNPQNTSQSFKK